MCVHRCVYVYVLLCLCMFVNVCVCGVMCVRVCVCEVCIGVYVCVRGVVTP